MFDKSVPLGATIAQSSAKILVGAGLALGLFAAPMPVHAAGDGGGSSSTPTPTCKKNYVYNKHKLKCVKAEKSSNLDDDNLYEAARDLAYAKRYEEALNVLKLASNQKDPRILNYLGYATRKSGDVKKGLSYYQAAIDINPDYTLARSYMGEAYLQLGDVANAKLQLKEIKLRCKGACPEYAALESQINGKPKKATW
ncbi:MAG: tetratricopeptide repeat protein [Rhizobiaceae bacterium]|nr:tetratricopeptide repeat protein [Hyphomicrobiales bacterium]NRB30690.1 tetratricopeptide repeat protein [Rhizobiaceae bacterium]